VPPRPTGYSPVARGRHCFNPTSPDTNLTPHRSAALLCKFAQFKGDGTYVFSIILYMPTGTGAATIQFEPFNQQGASYGDGFLHLDLMLDNTVRIEDNDAT
jgi:hypothetical protein